MKRKRKRVFPKSVGTFWLSDDLSEVEFIARKHFTDSTEPEVVKFPDWLSKGLREVRDRDFKTGYEAALLKVRETLGISK